jgi:hypothetical protein
VEVRHADDRLVDPEDAPQPFHNRSSSWIASIEA